MTTASFTGIPLAATDFYAELEAHNTKQWWTAHKGDYERLIKAPMEALAAALAPEFGDGKLFRPYRDVRFSADKTPYKTQQGLVVGNVHAVARYLRIDADGLAVGGGFRAHDPVQTAGWRRGIDQDGRALAAILDGLQADGYSVAGDALKTAPRGYAADHPHVELLRRKELLLLRDLGTPDWLATDAAAAHIATHWRALDPLLGWLTEHVPVVAERERRGPNRA